MSVTKSYRCDLCGSSITDKDGIAIYHKANGDIEPRYLPDADAGHHLCNTCVTGLRALLKAIDGTNTEHRV